MRRTSPITTFLEIPCIAMLLFCSVSSGQSVIDVKQYGAVGDGVADDRPAIQAAMNAAVQAGIPVVYFGPGTYFLGSSTSQYGQLAISNWNRVFSLDLIGNRATLQIGRAHVCTPV